MTSASSFVRIAVCSMTSSELEDSGWIYTSTATVPSLGFFLQAGSATANRTKASGKHLDIGLGLHGSLNGVNQIAQQGSGFLPAPTPHDTHFGIKR